MHDRHAHTVGGRSPEPAPIFPSRPCSLIGKACQRSAGEGSYTCNRELDCMAW